MKHTLSSVHVLAASLLVIATLLGSANAAIIVISFEDFPGVDGILGSSDDVAISAPTLFGDQGSQLTSEFASLGILFATPAQNDANEILDGSSFGDVAGQTQPNILASLGGRTIRGEFTLPIFSVGAVLGIATFGNDTLEIFDAGGQSLGSVTTDGSFQSISSATAIASFSVTSSVGIPAIDNLTFSTEPVPEPSSLVLLGLGMIGAAHRRRRG